MLDRADARGRALLWPQTRRPFEIEVRPRRVDAIVVTEFLLLPRGSLDLDDPVVGIDRKGAAVDVVHADALVHGCKRKLHLLDRHLADSDPDQAWKPREAVARRNHGNVGTTAAKARKMECGRMSGEARTQNDDARVHC